MLTSSLCRSHHNPLVALVALVVCVMMASPVVAQDPPGTDIYLVSLDKGDMGPVLGEPRKVTDRAGYDNQPHFLNDGSGLLYTSIREGQADIYLYDVEKGTHRAITNTFESEYSPTPIPGRKAISVVRVEADERQRLWSFPLAGGEPTLLLADVEPVGYHAWGDERRLALFVLGEPPTLQQVDLGGEARVIVENIGRSLHKIPGKDAISFIHKATDPWEVKRLDLVGGKVSTITQAFPGREDLTWSPQGVLWMADGSRLAYHCASCGGFQEVADFEAMGIQDITRLAIHPKGKMLAFVAARGAP